jgi:hypothetical protein
VWGLNGEWGGGGGGGVREEYSYTLDHKCEEIQERNRVLCFVMIMVM